MHIFVYEFATAGPLTTPAHSSANSLATNPLDQQWLADELLVDGDAMRRAVCEDLLSAGWQVSALLDAQRDNLATFGRVFYEPPGKQRADRFKRLAAAADGVLLIAPEIGGILTDMAHRVEQAGGRLLSPGSAFAAVAGDKQHTAEILSQAGVRVPRGVYVPAGVVPRLDQGPWVRKPLDGAGSWQVERLDHGCPSALPWPTRCERFCAGTPASVAVLCGPAAKLLLPACLQRLENQQQFTYLGGQAPLNPALNRRAQSLAIAALQFLPKTQGYVGVDLVLGAAENGAEDVVIEINPRLTSSYIGLRALCQQNLAAIMVQAALGVPETPTFHNWLVDFTAAGSIQRRA